MSHLLVLLDDLRVVDGVLEVVRDVFDDSVQLILLVRELRVLLAKLGGLPAGI